jgi:LysR family transcriptional regulator, nitrogen assimilation regulatory protein
VDLKHLATFIRVVQVGSISRAANELHYAQSTVSAHVQSLERSLGIKLLLRTANGVCPTGAGERLYGYAQSVVTLLDDAHREVPRASSSSAGRLP